MIAVVLAWAVAASPADLVGPLEACPAPERQGLKVALLTMGPGEEPFSVFGHTALWLVDRNRGIDVVFNFGTFDEDADPNSLLGDFLEGRMSYWLGTRSFDSMMTLYRRFDRTVVLQWLAIPEDEAHDLLAALRVNARPENRAYRYHWFRASCVTKVRDLVDEVFDGAIAAQHTLPTSDTHRSEVLRHLGPRLPFWFVWHFLVGGSADHPLTTWERAFVSDRLLDLFRETTVVVDGREQPLASPPCVVHEGGHAWPLATRPSRVLESWLAGSAWAALLLLLGLWGRRSRLGGALAGAAIALHGLTAATIGSISLYLWSASAYEGFWRNETLLMANPLSLALVTAVPALAFRRARRPFRWIADALLALGLAGLVIQLLPGFIQANAAPMGVFFPPLLAIAIVAHRRPQSRGRARTRPVSGSVQ